MSLANLKAYLSYDSFTWDKFFKQMVVKNGVVIAPKLDTGTCAMCGDTNGILQESSPSRARFNEGAVHYRVKCGNDQCQSHTEWNTWHIFPQEAIHAHNEPDYFKLAEDDETC